MSPGTCIHFNGWRDTNSRCAAGFLYREVVGPEPSGAFLRLPCFQYRVLPADGRGTYIKPGEPTVRAEIDRKGCQQAQCSCYIEPTDEQIERDRIDSEAHLNKVFAAMRVAGEWRDKKRPFRNRQDILECPICKGRLHLSQSSYNGHVHAKCETAGCVSWME